MANSGDGRIYVGNLPPNVRNSDLEDVFFKYGRINFVDLKNNKGPPFAFIEFDDPRDASDAVRYRDGYEYKHFPLRVEFPKNAMGRGGHHGDRGGGGFGGRGQFRSEYSRGSRSGPPSRRTDNRVLVSGLPASGSWQDLKDHMREAGDVCYADVYKDGTGVVEYLRREDMKYAVRKLDESKFRSHENEVSYIRIKEDNGSGSGSGESSSRPARASRSPLGRGRGSPSYSPVRDRDSRSHSRSHSPY